jgi:putative N6-adenine-specific DNA methylase
MEKLKITLKTNFGLEQVLQEELLELGFLNTNKLNRAVQLEGSWRDVYYLNLHVRCAICVLVEIKVFRIRDDKELYDKAMKIDWTSFFDVSKSFAVRGSVHSSLFTNTQYPYLLLKDAIVDVFRDKLGKRPDVQLKAPHVAFDIYIKEDIVTISLNTSGAPLFQRGYRIETGEAPMNEVVAAGLIRLSGWDRKSAFIDPFCGSGTLLMEAAFLASGIPSSIERQSFAFQHLLNFNSTLWSDIYDKALKKCEPFDFPIMGSDIDEEMVSKAQRNIRGLPFGRFIDLSVASFDDVKKPSESGVLISNPPYGQRIGENVEALYGELGDWFKQELKGYDCWIISSNHEAFKFVGLKPDKKIKLFNGDLECSYRKYKIFSGKRRDAIIDSLNLQNEEL